VAFLIDASHGRTPIADLTAKLLRMVAITFDTLKFVRTLEAAGVTAPQAEAIANAVRDSHDAADVATKGDLRELKAELKNEIAVLRQELKADTRELELRMTVKLGTMIVAAIGVGLALAKMIW
jgi:hypothetical protein